MRVILFVGIFLSIIKGYSQESKVKYTAQSIIMVFFNKSEAVVSKKPFGKNVEIIHDEFFKSWLIRYDDENGIRQVFKLAYVQQTPEGYERMKDTQGSFYTLSNKIKPAKYLYISFEKELDNGLHGALSIDGVEQMK